MNPVEETIAAVVEEVQLAAWDAGFDIAVDMTVEMFKLLMESDRRLDRDAVAEILAAVNEELRRDPG